MRRECHRFVQRRGANVDDDGAIARRAGDRGLHDRLPLLAPASSSGVMAAGRMPPTCMAQSIPARIAVYTDSVINMPRIATPTSDMVEKLDGFR